MIIGSEFWCILVGRNVRDCLPISKSVKRPFLSPLRKRTLDASGLRAAMSRFKTHVQAFAVLDPFSSLDVERYGKYRETVFGADTGLLVTESLDHGYRSMLTVLAVHCGSLIRQKTLV
jgi:hypothetical protein